MRPEVLQDKFRGLMVGTAVGDCLGRPIEGSRFVSSSYVDELINLGKTLLYSDDTIQTMAIAESLMFCKGFSGDDLSKRLVDGWQQDPERGYGSNVVLGFGKVFRGMPWEEAARAQFNGSGSYGNGGAMRVAPVSLWAYPDLDETVRLAQETAKVTHTHPVGVEGAVIQAVAAHHALMDPFSRADLLNDLQRFVGTDRFKSKMQQLEQALAEDPDDGWIREHLGNWVAADNSELTALYCFLVADDFQSALVRAIGLGGDTDTIAAMTGALAGARWGYMSIPDTWLNIERKSRLFDLGNWLFNVKHLGQIGWDGFSGPTHGEFAERQRPLVAEIIPEPGASWGSIGEFAETFDAYTVFEAHTSPGFAQLAELANGSWGEWLGSRLLPDDLVELRSCLFFERRRFRHFGEDPEGVDLEYMRALVEGIRTFV